MISLEQALKIHRIAIEKFGGANGVRDFGGLESALARPFQTFGGTDLYPTIFEKARSNRRKHYHKSSFRRRQ